LAFHHAVKAVGATLNHYIAAWSSSRHLFPVWPHVNVLAAALAAFGTALVSAG
jgi:hypothetical protein